MPVRISRLRRWLAASAIVLICVVAGFFFYARHRVQNALKQVPEKIGVEIQQSAKGFTISKSFQGRTLFKVEASQAVQFKAGGRGELHDVEITVYGRDSGRFDRIAGKDFEYDSVSGEVIGKGPVEIDLETNPIGFSTPDQAVPHDLRNPVHIKTTDLVFNQKTGDAHADGEVDFDVPQAHGSGDGLTYAAQNGVLTLDSHVLIALNGIMPMSVTADRLALSRSPRTLVLDHPRVVEGTEHSRADQATGFLSADNKLQRMVAEGNVLIESDRPDGGKISAGQLELIASANSEIREAVFTGDVQFRGAAENSIRGNAGRAVLHFGPQSKIKNVNADQGVVLSQGQSAKSKTTKFELTAPAVNFVVADGRSIRRAETSGPPQIKLGSPGVGSTVVTAAKFLADFDRSGQLARVHGSSSARLVSSVPGKPDRISTSDNLDANFHSGEINTFVQSGNFVYADAAIKGWAQTATYTLLDQSLLLGGSPRIVEGGMTTTAQNIRLNRNTGMARADGDVKTTDSSLNSSGSLFSGNSPIHVQAESLTATEKPAAATYTGKVRVWQNANFIEAPVVKLDREKGRVTAERNSTQTVSTTLNQLDKNGKFTTLSVTSDSLSYSNDDRAVQFQGSVSAVGTDFRLNAEYVECFLRKTPQSPDKGAQTATGLIDKIEALGSVVVRQPTRRATGNRLVYTAVDDKYIMTGGPPSIFDAEHGNVTGVSLTLFGHDARVLVEGSKQSPSVTQTRVAR